MDRGDDRHRPAGIAPWQRDLVVDARSGRRRDGGRGPHAGAPDGERPVAGPPAGRRPDPHPIFLAAPWAGAVALACAVFSAAVRIVPGGFDLSGAGTATAVAALVLGAYALAGGLKGRGRTDIAAAAVLLATVSVLVGIWSGRPGPLLTPT